ncbi:TIR domain-containing protein [Candidatus Thiodictyon syntrophicum]|uniref:TIR domain-containing protein n=1 Tax=Candidatus Thiodictyon syntrophicum TaxID=1166950 RepID=UPI001F0038A7|nr:TIR domain-containing protein [Candidatus Thiodictyon syntrophicum]
MDAPTTDLPVRLLHLSDLHFSTRSQWDADPILRALARFIAADIAAHQLYPDLVVITGDLANAGRREEYQLARQWLDGLWSCLTSDPATPLARDRLLLVPGNHDVDWGLIEPGARDAHRAMLAARTQDAITDRLKTKATRELLLKRHAAYLRFYSDWLGPRQARPWWQRSIVIRDQRLHVAGLDSAWLAGGDDDSRLLLSTYQINQTVLHPDGEGDWDWRLALLHHPWASLAEFDRNDAQRTLHRHRDLILRGHLHQPDHFRIVPADPRYACIEAAAGCCYSGKPYPNAFQWIELSTRPRRVEFHFRCWNQDDWQVDRNQHGCPEGTHSILVPVERGAGKGPRTPGDVGRAAESPGPVPNQPEDTQPTQSSASIANRVAAAGVNQVGPADAGHGTRSTGSANAQAASAQPTQVPAIVGDQVAPPDGPRVTSPAQPQRNQEDSPAFDCFLSHNTKDKSAVRALAAALRAAGVSVWLDEDELRPGLPWQPQLELGIVASSSVAVLVGADGLGPWEVEEQQAALALAVRDQRPVIPVLLSDAPRVPQLPMFLANRTWVDLRASPDTGDAGGLDRLIWGITGRRPGAPGAGSKAGRLNGDPSRPDRVQPDAQPVPPNPVHQTAPREIAANLDAVPALVTALAAHVKVAPPAGAQEVAAWLCRRDADGVRAAMGALRQAVRDATLAVRRAQGDLTPLRERARAILGWLSVLTVLDDYAWPYAPKVTARWFDGAAFRIPLGRNACIEVLAARWAGRPADFESGRDRWDYGRYDISPHPKADPGVNELLHMDLEPALNYVRRLVYQHIEGKEPPPVLDPDTWQELRERVTIRRDEKGEQRRIVLDGRGATNAFDYAAVLKAIHADIPEVHLIVLVGPGADHPEVFLLPAAKLSGQIKECLEDIEAMT